MAPLGIINIEWLNANSQRSYPLTILATKLDKTGTVTIPDSFIVELYFPVHAGLDVQPDKFFLSGLGIFTTGYNVTISYDDGSSSPPVVGVVNIATDSHTPNLSYDLPGSGDFSDSIGTITIGSLDDISAQPPGQYTFSPAGGQLEPDAIRPMIIGIQSITLVNGNDRSTPLYGDIELIAGTNIRLSTSLLSGHNPTIVISAVSGEGLNANCECVDDTTGPCIKTINGIQPKSDGDFVLAGNSCVQLTEVDNGLTIKDSCSSPCCGCTELDALKTQLVNFGNAKNTLETFVNTLSASVNTMRDVVLSSRLSDQGCNTC